MSEVNGLIEAVCPHCGQTTLLLIPITDLENKCDYCDCGLAARVGKIVQADENSLS